MSREAFDADTAAALGEAQTVSGNGPDTATQPGPGRRRMHTSSAARVAAYRASHQRLDFVTNERIAATVQSLAEQFDTSKNDVLNSLVRFALTNRNWRQQGLWGGKQEQALDAGDANCRHVAALCAGAECNSKGCVRDVRDSRSVV